MVVEVKVGINLIVLMDIFFEKYIVVICFVISVGFLNCMFKFVCDIWNWVGIV